MAKVAFSLPSLKDQGPWKHEGSLSAIRRGIDLIVSDQ